MNKLKIIALTFLVAGTVSFSTYAQEQETGLVVAELVRKGSARELAQHFNNFLQLQLPDDDGRYSKTQGEFIIKRFFTNYPPKSFTILHQGSSNDGSLYYIGSYISDKGSFRTYYLLKAVDNKLLIHQFRVESEK